MDSLLSILIPAVITIIGSIVTAVIVGRRGKESNNTDAFEAVTAQLFKLNTDLRSDVDALKKEVAALRLDNVSKDAENASLHHENGELHEEVGKLRDKVAVMTKANGALLAFTRKVLRLWPPGTTLPTPDEPIEGL